MIALNHYIGVEELDAVRRRATLHAYPRWYRQGDPATGELVEVSTDIEPSDLPAVSDYQAKRGVWSLYVRNDGVLAIKHLDRALTLRLRALVLMRPDRSYDVVTTPSTPTPFVEANRITWEDVFPGVNRVVSVAEDQFRDVLEISAAARASLGAYAASHGHGADSYMAFVYDLDAKSLDGTSPLTFDLDADGDSFAVGDTAEATGRISFRVAGRLKQFLSPGWITAPDGPPSVEFVGAKKLLRFFRVGEQARMLEGARLGDIATLPAGRLLSNATITFQEGDGGYSGTKWYGSYGDNTDKTYRTGGADNGLWAGQYDDAPGRIYRGAIEWDVTDIPADATVDAAVVSLWFVKETVATDYNVTLYKSLKDWNTPAADSDPADTNDPCWDYQYYSGTAWDTAGHAGEDADRDTDVSATASVTALNTEIQFTSANLTTLVGVWVANSANNHGVCVVGVESGVEKTKQWACPTHGTAGYRPKLSVDYTPVAGGQPFRKRFGGVPYAALNNGVW